MGPPEDNAPVTLLYRIIAMEQNLADLKEQLRTYEPARENELKLQYVQTFLTRLDSDLKTMHEKLEELLLNQEKGKVRVLWGTISTVIMILTGILVGYINHFFH